MTSWRCFRCGSVEFARASEVHTKNGRRVLEVECRACGNVQRSRRPIDLQRRLAALTWQRARGVA